MLTLKQTEEVETLKQKKTEEREAEKQSGDMEVNEVQVQLDKMKAETKVCIAVPASAAAHPFSARHCPPPLCRSSGLVADSRVHIHICLSATITIVSCRGRCFLLRSSRSRG